MKGRGGMERYTNKITDTNSDDRRCTSCEHYATYLGVCCSTKSPYAADERDGYHSCDFWEKRVEGKFNKKNGECHEPG